MTTPKIKKEPDPVLKKLAQRFVILKLKRKINNKNENHEHSNQQNQV
jgi:hypothetical protein